MAENPKETDASLPPAAVQPKDADLPLTPFLRSVYGMEMSEALQSALDVLDERMKPADVQLTGERLAEIEAAWRSGPDDPAEELVLGLIADLRARNAEVEELKGRLRRILEICDQYKRGEL